MTTHYHKRMTSRLGNDDNSDGNPDYSTAKVLILTFELYDLDINEDIWHVFESMGYQVERYGIPVVDSTRQLNARLRQFMESKYSDSLFIIYYNGHGCIVDIQDCNADADAEYNTESIGRLSWSFRDFKGGRHRGRVWLWSLGYGSCAVAGGGMYWHCVVAAEGMRFLGGMLKDGDAV
ncbi:hypothetical protein B0T24DRAFT_722635 [Lasiosphaeria ovina]|uniref:Uncharacterized protein n=1 Tax=Lasiosphaeria ovina TaxID=92902 RepID=A0AAE0JZ34_9PEZI|nr:hypothetical protein B0T24DRAFT_722635 [Lasiosphaeria ovina]